MNVFVLCTGRCGSTTFTKACAHISNYTSLHESRTKKLGDDRLDYPKNHIEVDNRLSWLLGRLDVKYGDGAFYVHLKRNREDVATSFFKRYDRGIIKAYRSGVLMRKSDKYGPMDVCLDYVDSVNSNIELFLKNKKNKMEFNIENYKSDFKQFYNKINAEGNLDKAVLEFSTKYNKTK